MDTVLTTGSISRRTSAVSNKRSREEDANFKSSSKAKKPLDNQDSKRSREENANFKSSSKAKKPLGSQDSKSRREKYTNFKSSSKAKRSLDNQELKHSSDSYTEGQTGLIDLIPKSSDSDSELGRNFFAHLAQLHAKVRAEANCPIAQEKKEAARKRNEEIDKMTPEQYQRIPFITRGDRFRSVTGLSRSGHDRVTSRWVDFGAFIERALVGLRYSMNRRGTPYVFTWFTKAREKLLAWNITQLCNVKNSHTGC